MKLHRGLLLLLTAGTVACGIQGSPCWWDCPVSPNIALCGFPASQIESNDEQPIVSVGRLRVGQRIPLELTGDLDQVADVEWRVDHQPEAQQPPVARLTRSGRFTAVLEGVAVGGTGPSDYVYASAMVTFRDGNGRGPVPSACSDGYDFAWADRIVVVP